MTVFRSSDVRFEERSPGIQARQLVNREKGAVAVTVGELIMAPGTSLDLHTHSTEEVIVITEGTATLICGEDTQAIEAGDAVLAPALASHLVANRSQEPVRFLFFFPTANVQRELVKE